MIAAVMSLSRRALLAAVLPVLLAPARGRAATVADGAGRAVPVPAQVARVFPAGPPAAIMLYTLAPSCCWAGRAPMGRRSASSCCRRSAAGREVGRITGRGNTANLEAVLALKPDLILDIGDISPTYVSLADRVQEQTGIPYALLDGRFEAAAAAYRTLGALIDRRDAAEGLARDAETTLATITGRIAGTPRERRPRVYYARGPRGLETGLGGALNMETIELLAQNVAGGSRGGLATVSIEQVLVWNPDVIVTIDPDFAAAVAHDPAWALG